MTVDVSKVASILKGLKLDGWSLIMVDEERSSLYITKNEEIETSIDSRRTSADVTVYRRFGKQVGDARFTIFSDDEEALKAKVKDALLTAATAKKQAWPLPKRQAYADVRLADEAIVKAFSSGKAGATALSIWELMRAAGRHERGIVVSSAEIHLARRRARVANSEGLEAENDRTELFVEAVLTASRRSGPTREEQEFHAAETAGRLADFDAQAFVRDHSVLSRDILAAERFSGVQEERLVLTGEALRDFWSPGLDLNPAVFHAGAQMKYRDLSRYEVGKRVTNNESFTLSSNPLLPYNPGSSRFDLDGVASQRVAIIEKGVMRSFFASQRYASYLGVKATGALGATELSPGSEGRERLLEDGCIEIVAFSSFSPNSVSGDFSAEIRLGYVHRRGKRVPIRGAMLSGNVFAMLDAMRGSKETVTMERYSGPSLVRFDDGARLAGF